MPVIKEKAQRYISLDVVRGLAALSVLLTHWGQWTGAVASPVSKGVIDACLKPLELIWGGQGIHPGVVVFIVLSGFCIHLPQVMRPTNFKHAGFWPNFAVRRAIRIMPVYWVALALGVVSIILMHTSNDTNEISFRIIFSFIGFAEIARFFNESAVYWVVFYPGNGPLTTVGVEMLLYASYPLFMLIHKNYGPAALIIYGLAGYCGIAAARFLGVPTEFIHGTYFEFMLYWIIGALCAELFAKIGNRPLTMNRVKFCSLILATLHLLSIHSVQIKGFHVVTTAILASTTGLVLIWALSFEVKSQIGSNKIFQKMGALGARSYSLYVIHTPIILLSIYYLKSSRLSDLTPWVILLITFLATELMYKGVEYPCHQYARKQRI